MFEADATACSIGRVICVSTSSGATFGHDVMTARVGSEAFGRRSTGNLVRHTTPSSTSDAIRITTATGRVTEKRATFIVFVFAPADGYPPPTPLPLAEAPPPVGDPAAPPDGTPIVPPDVAPIAPPAGAPAGRETPAAPGDTEAPAAVPAGRPPEIDGDDAVAAPAAGAVEPAAPLDVVRAAGTAPGGAAPVPAWEPAGPGTPYVGALAPPPAGAARTGAPPPPPATIGCAADSSGGLVGSMRTV